MDFAQINKGLFGQAAAPQTTYYRKVVPGSMPSLGVRVPAAMNRLKHPGYYTKMGVAWCVATAYAKFPRETMGFMRENGLDDWTYNKAIQKMRESYRVPAADKEILLGMKRVGSDRA